MMKLAIILSSNVSETNWNVFRLANVALSKGDTVSVFLLGEGVEYSKNNSVQFEITQQVQKFLEADGKIIACGTCMTIRKQKSTQECPVGGIEDLYNLIVESDKVLTF